MARRVILQGDKRTQGHIFCWLEDDNLYTRRNSHFDVNIICVPEYLCHPVDMHATCPHFHITLQGDLGGQRPHFFDFIFQVLQSGPTTIPFLPNSHRPKLNWADSVTTGGRSTKPSLWRPWSRDHPVLNYRPLWRAGLDLTLSLSHSLTQSVTKTQMSHLETFNADSAQSKDVWNENLELLMSSADCLLSADCLQNPNEPFRDF